MISVEESFTKRELQVAALEMLRRKRCSLWPSVGWIVSSDKSDEKMFAGDGPVAWLLGEFEAVLEVARELRERAAEEEGVGDANTD